MKSEGWKPPILIAAAAAALLMASFLSIHVLRPVEGGIGWDTVEYTWRTKLAMAEGVERVPAGLPFPVKEGRPAFPAIASILTTMFGASSPAFATVALPPVLAVAIGLAAGALCAVGLGLGRWATAFVAVFVGISANVVLMMRYAYLDNMMLTAVFLAAGAFLVAAARSPGAAVPAALLLGSLALLHGAFFPMAIGVVILTALVLLPGSWSAWRSGSQPLSRTPAAVVGGAGLGGALLGSAALGLLGARPRPALIEDEFVAKLDEDLPYHTLPLTIPLAAAGAAATARGGHHPSRRTLLGFLLAWSAVVGIGFLLWSATDLAVPVNRLLVFALPIPVLSAVAVWLLLRRLSARRPRIAIAAGVLALAIVGAAGGFHWLRTDVFMDVAKMRAAARAGSYLSTVEQGRPVVFLVDDEGTNTSLTVGLLRDHLLAALPVERFGDVHLYLGAPDAYRRGEPTRRPGNEPYAQVSRSLLERIDRLDAEPIALLVEEYGPGHFRRWVAEHPDSIVAPGVALVPGPTLPGAGGAPPRDPPPGMRSPLGLPSIVVVAVAPVAILALFLVVGLGWTLAATRRWASPLQALALAPAVGIAVLIAGSVALDRLGVPPSGLSGWLVPAMLAGMGWSLHALRRVTVGSSVGASRGAR